MYVAISCGAFFLYSDREKTISANLHCFSVHGFFNKKRSKIHAKQTASFKRLHMK